MTTEEEKEYGIEGACEILGRQYRTVLRYIHSGQLRARLHEHKWLISATDLLEFIAKMEQLEEERRKKHEAKVLNKRKRPEESVYATIEDAIEAALSGKVKPLYLPRGVSSIAEAKRLAERAAGDEEQPPPPEKNAWHWPGGE
jgi:hypothetical protein